MTGIWETSQETADLSPCFYFFFLFSFSFAFFLLLSLSTSLLFFFLHSHFLFTFKVANASEDFSTPSKARAGAFNAGNDDWIWGGETGTRNRGVTSKGMGVKTVRNRRDIKAQGSHTWWLLSSEPIHGCWRCYSCWLPKMQWLDPLMPLLQSRQVLQTTHLLARAHISWLMKACAFMSATFFTSEK